MLCFEVLVRVKVTTEDEVFYTGYSTTLWLDDFDALEKHFELWVIKISRRFLGDKGIIFLQHESGDV